MKVQEIGKKSEEPMMKYVGQEKGKAEIVCGR